MRLETNRLTLIALTLSQLALLLADRERLEEELGLRLLPDMMTDPVPRAIRMKIGKMEGASVRDHLWYTYWLIVISDERVGAGLVGFKGIPDHEGKTEIGYGIGQKFQGRGFMTEAVGALITWAFDHDACKAVTADKVLPDNIASQKVLGKVGMSLIRSADEGLYYQINKPRA